MTAAMTSYQLFPYESTTALRSFRNDNLWNLLPQTGSVLSRQKAPKPRRKSLLSFPLPVRMAKDYS